MRSVTQIVIDGVVGDHHSAVLAERLAGIRVYVESREVAAGDVDPNAMTFLENICRRKRLDDEFVDFAWLH